jgi:hypothetical protein
MKRRSILALRVEHMTLKKMILRRLGSDFQSSRKSVRNLVVISTLEL